MVYKKVILGITLVICPLSLHAMEPETKPTVTQEPVQEKKAYGTLRAWKLRAIKLAGEPTKVTRSASVSLPMRNKSEMEIQKSNSAQESGTKVIPVNTPYTPTLKDLQDEHNMYINRPISAEKPKWEYKGPTWKQPKN